MVITMLKDLALKGRHWTISVRVSRMWEYRGGTDDGPIRHVDMVLLDAEGTPMYAEIGSDDVKDKKPLFSEGKVYTLQRFRVINAKSTYKPVPSNLMISITYHTLVEENQNVPDDFPMYVYSLTKFSDLPSLVGENKYFVDVMGTITEVSDMAAIHLPNQRVPTVRRIITLRDSSNYEMKLHLQGKRASKFNADEICAISQEEPVVVIFVGTLMKSYKGENSLSGNAACRWYINPDVPEYHEFLLSLGDSFEPVKLTINAEQPSILAAPAAQPLTKSLEEIKRVNIYNFPPEGFECTVTISRVNTGQSWWYPACN